jgi:hypothetical protein
MSRRASGIVLLLLSFPLLMLGITAWKQATREAGVRAWQLEQAVSAPDPTDRPRFAGFASDTLERQRDTERNRNWFLAVAVAAAVGGAAFLVADRKQRRDGAGGPAAAGVGNRGRSGGPAATGVGNPEQSGGPAAAGVGNPEQSGEPSSPLRPCRACQWTILVEATACPRCGCPHVPVVSAPPAEPPLPVNKAQRAFYVALLCLGVGSAVMIYTVLFDNLSGSTLVQISPYWIFPTVFGYYGLVAQRMEARLTDTHLATVSDQLLTVIKELGGGLGQAFAFLIHAPFLIVKDRRPWVVAFVGSLTWAIALIIFFNAVFPTL